MCIFWTLSYFINQKKLHTQTFQPDSLIIIYAPLNLDQQEIRVSLPFGKSQVTDKITVLYESQGKTFNYSLSSIEKIKIIDVYVQGKIDIPSGSWILVNGFQSWTSSNFSNCGFKQKPIRKVFYPFAQYYGDYNIFPYREYPQDQHSWYFTCVKHPNGTTELLSSIDESQGYTFIQWNCSKQYFKLKKDCEGKLLDSLRWSVFSIFYASCTEPKIYELWYDALSSERKINQSSTYHRGWSSWYNYFNRITPEIILQNAKNFRNIREVIIQIDDGYQKSVGDWLYTNKKFPTGLIPLTDSIHAYNLKAGLWIAPFVCDRKSSIFREHRDWILKTEKGKIITVGFNPYWGGRYFALDLYNPEVRKYLEAVFDTIINSWNFDFIKADFLFAAAIKPRPELNKSRGEVMFDALSFLREISGKKLLLLCGTPIGSSFGLTDFCRIGNDMHLGWEMHLLKWFRAAERPSTYSSLTNSICRGFLGNRVFFNDPDVFILRRKNQRLSNDEKILNLFVNHLFGQLLFTSDDIHTYEKDNFNLYEKCNNSDFKIQYFNLLQKDLYNIKCIINGVPLHFVLNMSHKNYVVDNLKFNKKSLYLQEGDKYVKLKSLLEIFH